MGEAKKRGTFEERKATAHAKREAAKRGATKWEIAVIVAALAYSAVIVMVFRS